MRTKIISLFTALFLSGCTTYYQPVPDNYQGETSYISDSQEYVSSSRAHFFVIDRVDGNKIKESISETMQSNYGKGFSLTPSMTGRSLPAEKMILTIYGHTYDAAPILSLLPGNYNVKGDVVFTPVEGERYHINGYLRKEYSAVWIEHSATNKIVSKIIEEGGLTTHSRNEFKEWRAAVKEKKRELQENEAKRRREGLAYMLEIQESGLCASQKARESASDMFHAGKSLYAMKYYAQAMNCFKNALVSNDTHYQSMYYIGLMHEFGFGVEENIETAKLWYERSNSEEKR